MAAPCEGNVFPYIEPSRVLISQIVDHIKMLYKIFYLRLNEEHTLHASHAQYVSYISCLHHFKISSKSICLADLHIHFNKKLRKFENLTLFYLSMLMATISGKAFSDLPQRFFILRKIRNTKTCFTIYGGFAWKGKIYQWNNCMQRNSEWLHI